MGDWTPEREEEWLNFRSGLRTMSGEDYAAHVEDMYAALLKARKERDAALARVEALEAEVARYASPTVDGRTLGEWRSVGVTAPWEPLIQRAEQGRAAALRAVKRMTDWAKRNNLGLPDVE